MSHILVISPHPDDDAIGCGGTLYSHVVHGDSVYSIYLTSGEKGGHGLSQEETGPLREQEAKNAAQILGITQIEFWRQPDGALCSTPELIEKLRNVVKSLQPQILYVTHEMEMHPDHKVAAEIVRNTLSDQDSSIIKPLVRMFEVWTPLQSMDDIVDISPYIEVKIAAIRKHKSQCDVLRFDDAFRGLSRYRGEMFSWPQRGYAEIFQRMRI